MMVTICEYESGHREDIIRMIVKIQREEFHLPITAEDQPDLADIETSTGRMTEISGWLLKMAK